MSKTRLTVLVENTAQGHGLLAEHGLSFWIETGSRRILFDAGQTRILARNADRSGIDVSSADAVILSHGHYDHTGGLPAVARPRPGRDRAPCPVYLHPQALAPKYARNRDGTARSIGMPDAARRALQDAFEMRTTEAPTEIGDGLTVTGPIPRVTDFEDTGGPFYSDASCRAPDALTDDQAAFLETAAGTVVFLGCAHAGIVNTLYRIRDLTPGRRIHTVIGGLHLAGAGKARMEKTVDALRAFDIARLFPLHCTGFQAAARLWTAFPDRVASGPVGTRLEWPA
ncbi:MAG: MBL fold metallo-hydrolase [Lentisphaerae bacterium]|nr:MBL fold metallo-hydrolase [Lentisphaerota bacterium]